MLSVTGATSSVAVSGSQGSSRARAAGIRRRAVARGVNIRSRPSARKGRGAPPRLAHNSGERGAIRAGPPRAAQRKEGPPGPAPRKGRDRAAPRHSRQFQRIQIYPGRLANLPGYIYRKMPLVGQRRPALPRTHSAVPSALGGLTSGFGMGPGVPPPPWSLTNEGHSAVRGRPGRALRAAQRATGSRDRARRRVTHRHLWSRVMEELGLLVTLG